MAKSSTTHVIEIESGIGEPAFVPLALGEELHPVSVGKKGMWRIESAGVLEVHAFVYFDGNALFMKSADEASPASVDGYAIGKTWTELHAPCKIEVGGARLRYRSLSGPSSDRAPRSSQRKPESVAPISPRRVEEPRSSRAPRPFKPGEFSNAPQRGESTRVAPVERGVDRDSVARAPVTNAWDDNADAMQTEEIEQVPRPPAGAAGPVAPENMTLAMAGPEPSELPAAMMMPFTQTPGAFSQYPQGPLTGPPMYDPYGQGQGYPPIGTQNNYNPTPGSQIGGAAPGMTPSYLAKFKELTPPQRALVILAPFCLLSAAYLLLFDDTHPAKVATDADAGAEVASSASVAVGSAVAAAPLVPSCPAGFVPYSIPINGQIPCVPAGTPMPAAPATSNAGNGIVPPPAATVATATATKTLERQAVDYVAAGNYTAAAQIYEQLQRQNPNSRVYAEAARILRAKADAGVP